MPGLLIPLLFVTYEILDLGQTFTPADVNSAGVVVGSVQRSVPSIAARYTPGRGLEILGAQNGFSVALGINDDGVIVGQMDTAMGRRGFILEPGGTMRVLPGPMGGYALEATDINAAGEISGSIVGPGYRHAARWSHLGAAVTDLGTLGGSSSRGVDINDLGEVAGESDIDDSGVDHLFLYRDGAMLDLGSGGNGGSSATGMNDAGQVTGYFGLYVAAILASPAAHATFLWTGNPVAAALAINNRGEVLGYRYDPQVIPLLWRGGTQTDVNTLLPEDAGWHIRGALAINDCTFIAGVGEMGSSTTPRGYLLRPAGVETCSNAYVVNSTADRKDEDTSDGFCDTGMMLMIGGLEVPECTLRAAIEQGEAAPGKNTIDFGVPGAGDKVIAPATVYPTLTGPTAIRGTTQPTGRIVLDGTGKSFDGLTVAGSGTSIRGLVIQGFGRHGIVLQSGSGNVIAGNTIGGDLTGVGGWGIDVRPAAGGNTIGGGGEADRNVIGGNRLGGIRVTGAAGVTIEGNYVGTTLNGTASSGNGLGNGAGIRLDGAAEDTVVRDNLISGNYNVGLEIGGSADGTIVTGNLIGTAAGGMGPLPNRGYGINVSAVPGNSVIGGVLPGEANTIAYNELSGVRVGGAIASKGNTIRGNAIFANNALVNPALAIDLTSSEVLGPTLNDRPVGDVPDRDDGPNGLQNFPDLASAGKDGTALVVFGDLWSTPSRTFTVDLYASQTCDPTGYGEAERYLGTATVSTDGSGRAPLMISVPGAAATTSLVAATATDADGDTSELSRCIAVGDADLRVGIDDSPGPAVAVGNNIVYSVTVTNDGPDAATGATMDFTLAPKTSLVLTSPPLECTTAAQVVTCTLGGVAAGETKTFQVHTKVSSDPVDIFYFLDAAHRELTAAVQVRADQHDPAEGNNAANETTLVGTVGVGPGNNRPGDSGRPGDHDRPMNQVTVTGAGGSPKLPATGDATLTAVEISAGGTGNDATAVAAVKLYLDADGDGAVGGGDTLLAMGRFPADDGKLVLSPGGGLPIPAGQARSLLVAYDFATTIALTTPALPRGWPLALLAATALLGARRVRWRRLGLAAGLSLLAVCGGGGEDGGDADGGNVGVDGGGNGGDGAATGPTFHADLTGLTLTDGTTGQPVAVAGLPIAGPTVTIAR